jgi:hypothetical protein
VLQVRVAEISSVGCLVTGNGLVLRAGDSIRIAIANLEALPGKVVSASPVICGIEFERPLHPSVAAHLARTR